MKKSTVANLALAPLFSLAGCYKAEILGFCARVDSFRLSLGYSRRFLLTYASTCSTIYINANK